MPFALITLGVMLFITALNGTSFALVKQVYADVFTGTPSFFYWVLALLVVGMIGYIPGAKKPADAFMVLIIIGMVLATNGGVFTNIQSVLSTNATTAPTANPLQAVPVTAASSNPVSSLLSVVGPIASLASLTL